MFSPSPLYELQRSEGQRQADILDRELSEISCVSQYAEGARGESIEPNSIEVEKHSRINDVDLLDFCHEYHKHASPG